VLLRSLGALAAKRSTMIGLLAQYSLDAMEPLLRKRNASLTYQVLTYSDKVVRRRILRLVELSQLIIYIIVMNKWSPFYAE
jgi:hypothetical protein